MKILIICLAGIGDFIMATPAVRALRERYPDARIDLLTFPMGAKDVLDGSKYIDNNYIYVDKVHIKTREMPSIVEVFRNSALLLFKLRLNRYDLSLSFYPSASDKQGLVARLINAKKRIGFTSKHYTHSIKANFLQHKIDQNLKLLNFLHINVKNRCKNKFFHVLEENKNFADVFFNKNKLNGLVICMHPGAWWKANAKKWPLENYIALVDMLIKKYNAKIIVNCGPSEEGGGYQLQRSVQNKKNVFILEKQNLKNVAAVISKCDFFIGGDSGVMHVAEAVNIPIVEIPGYARYKFSGVYKKENKKNVLLKRPKCYWICPVLKKHKEEFWQKGSKIPCNLECFKWIKPEDVFNKLSELIKKRA